MLSAIAGFLGLAPFPDTAPQQLFSRPDITFPSQLTEGDIRKLSRLYADDVREFAAVSGLDVRDWLTMRASG